MTQIFGIFSSIAIAVLTYIVQLLIKDNIRLRQSRKEEIEKKEHALRDGVTCLLRVQLIEYHEKYMDKHGIPNYAYENWEKMYKAYRELGGNGMLIQMDEDIRELEFKK